MVPRKKFPWSSAETPEAAGAFRAEASRLAGEVIARVCYVDIDYRAEDFRNATTGPRAIERDVEWADPTWRHAACDSVDFGVEIETVTGRRFTVSWETPGWREGLGLRELPLLGNAVDRDARVAIWDVTTRSSWAELVGQQVTSVELHYEPWDESGAVWCSWISVRIGARNVEFVLGDGSSEGDEIAPAADNVAVIFGECRLPAWLVERQR